MLLFLINLDTTPKIHKIFEKIKSRTKCEYHTERGHIKFVYLWIIDSCVSSLEGLKQNHSSCPLMAAGIDEFLYHLSSSSAFHLCSSTPAKKPVKMAPDCSHCADYTVHVTVISS